MKRFGWFLACVLAIGLSGAARAQQESGSEGDLGKDWDIRAGFFIPENQSMRQAAGDIWFTFGAERTVYEGDRYHGTLSIDYYGKDRYYNIPILLNLRTETSRFHYGLGAGVSFGNGLEHGTTAFAYNFLVGYTLVRGTKPIEADIRYRGIAHGKGMLNGWAITVGAKF